MLYVVADDPEVLARLRLARTVWEARYESKSEPIVGPDALHAV